jgi:hypothetical protein
MVFGQTCLFDINLKNRLIANRFCERQFFITFFVYNFSLVFSKLKKKKKLYESRFYKRQFSCVFSNFKKIYMKVVFCKDDFHII